MKKNLRENGFALIAALLANLILLAVGILCYPAASARPGSFLESWPS